MAVTAAKRNGANYIMNHRKNRYVENAKAVASCVDFMCIRNALPFNVFETVKGDWKRYSVGYESYIRSKARVDNES